MKDLSKNNRGGFTLAELLVAMSVFIIVTTVAVGAFIQTLKSERHLVTLIAVSNEVNSAVEQMTREMRTGYLFATSTLNGEGALTFYNFAGDLTTYSVSASGALLDGNSAITSGNVVVAYLNFIVSQAGQGSVNNACYPWRVTAVLGVKAAGSAASVDPVYVQTTVSSRILPKDVPPKFKYASSQIYNCN
ncbi:type II secretion system GspH family protein [Patescibacteria group bacterium]|nr:type II secretion system GspH family protein [Patescibacteria group bacterium]